MTTVGNDFSRAESGRAMMSVPRFLILAGPEHVGKASFARGFLEQVLDESDLMLADPGPDGARAARSFLADMPSFSPFRAVFVDDMDFLSEPAQDSWLKLCEETPGNSCIVGVAADPGLLLPPLLSRAVEIVRWSPVSDDDVSSYASSLGGAVDDVAVRMCCGRPGLYPVLASGGYVSLYESVLSQMASPSLDSPIPDVVKSLESGRTPERDAVSLVVRRAAISAASSSPSGSVAFLRYAASIVRVPSANAELHWLGAVTYLL